MPSCIVLNGIGFELLVALDYSSSRINRESSAEKRPLPPLSSPLLVESPPGEAGPTEALSGGAADRRWQMGGAGVVDTLSLRFSAACR
jgi:hypothetical protein